MNIEIFGKILAAAAQFTLEDFTTFLETVDDGIALQRALPILRQVGLDTQADLVEDHQNNNIPCPEWDEEDED